MRSFEAWLRAYRGMAVFALNCVLLFALMTFSLNLFLRWHASRQPVYSDRFDLDSYRRIDRDAAILTGREFDEMGDAESYQFHPWTVFIERPFDGELVGVNERSERRTPTPEVAAGRPRLLVWVFGGSTTFGWGLPDAQTVPAHLQQHLQARFPERRVEVVNHGHAYWFSSMELAHFAALLREREKPSIAIFLDGLNDSLRLTQGRTEPFFTSIAAGAWELERKRRYQSTSADWFTVNESFPPLRLARLLQRPSAQGDREADLARVATAVEMFRTNRASIQGIGAANGVPVLQFLQPIPSYGRYSWNTAPIPDGMLKFYDALVGEAPREHFIPITDVLADVARPYLDPTHYSDEGAYRVAGGVAGPAAALIDATSGARSDPPVPPPYREALPAPTRR